MNFFLTLSLAAVSAFGAAETAVEPVRVLILSGQNNHNWRETTPFLKKVLTSSGDCVVDVTEAPENMTAQSLKRYHVLVSNWNTFVDDGVFEWPEAARSALIEFVRGGKGSVSVHGGSSSFYDWSEYQKLGIAAWKDGRTDHGPAHTFTVNPVGDHPIIRGVEPFKTHDELWHDAQVQPGAEVLATAFSSRENGGSGKDEPMVLVRGFGKGRSVNILLGHDAKAMATPAFRTLVRRSVVWAATGDVKSEPGMNKQEESKP